MGADFADALRHVKAGGKARRPLWRELEGRVALHLELATIDGLGDVLICPVEGRNPALFACSQWDILADDWELLGD